MRLAHIMTTPRSLRTRHRIACPFLWTSMLLLDIARLLYGADLLEVTSFDKGRHPEIDTRPKHKVGGRWRYL